MGERPPMVTCPYDEAHVVEASRLAFHVAKCSKAARGGSGSGSGHRTTRRVCPFNASHHVAPELLEEHARSCGDRVRFDAYVFQVGDSAPAIELPQVPHIQDEDWGDQFDAPAYNPQENLDNKEGQVMHALKGAQPAERRAHRMRQRRNFTKENK